MRKQTGIGLAVVTAAAVVGGTIVLYRAVNPEPARQQIAAQRPAVTPGAPSGVLHQPVDVSAEGAETAPTASQAQPGAKPQAVERTSSEPGAVSGPQSAAPQQSRPRAAPPAALPVNPSAGQPRAVAGNSSGSRGNPPAPAPQVPGQPGETLGEPVVPLPTARSALALVGDDPAAEAVWVQAINDPNLPPSARKDLIEDLNEDGFPDLKNLSPDDLPLIQNRIELIETLANDAMDEVNAAAFEEAYKDLQNMRRKVMGM